MSKPFPPRRFTIRKAYWTTKVPWMVADRERPSYVGRFATFDIALRSTLEPGDRVKPDLLARITIGLLRAQRTKRRQSDYALAGEAGSEVP